ncbi:MAG: MarR family transcriptional regulator [Micavibrio sp.]|nr:MarR family transcriptional regulator [Micavibrio sp.]
MVSHLEAQFAAHNISFVQYKVLITIREGRAMIASEICQNLFHDSGALARMLEQLEARGILTRVRSEKDRRRVEMEITPAGHDLLNTLLMIVIDFWNEVLGDFTKQEADQLSLLVRRMTDKMIDLQKVKD